MRIVDDKISAYAGEKGSTWENLGQNSKVNIIFLQKSTTRKEGVTSVGHALKFDCNEKRKRYPKAFCCVSINGAIKTSYHKIGECPYLDYFDGVVGKDPQ